MSKLDDEVRALFKRYRGDDLHALLMACGLRFDGVPGLPLELPGYLRPTTRELTDAERAMLAAVDEQLLSQRPCPVPEATSEERFADLVERHAHESPATRAAALLRLRRDRVRYGVRRLRSGNEWDWQRPLMAMRAETATVLRQLGHERLARVVAGWAATAAAGGTARGADGARGMRCSRCGHLQWREASSPSGVCSDCDFDAWCEGFRQPACFSVRTANVLRKLGMNALERLSREFSESGRLATIKGLGRKSENELIEHLVKNGHGLPGVTAEVAKARARVEVAKGRLERAQERYRAVIRRQTLAKRVKSKTPDT